MGEDLFRFNTDKRITTARSTTITIAPIAKPLIPPSLPPPLDELPVEDPFTMPGGADPDDHWFPPVLDNAAKTVITHESAVKKSNIMSKFHLLETVNVIQFTWNPPGKLVVLQIP